MSRFLSGLKFRVGGWDNAPVVFDRIPLGRCPSHPMIPLCKPNRNTYLASLFPPDAPALLAASHRAQTVD